MGILKLENVSYRYQDALTSMDKIMFSIAVRRGNRL